MCELCGNGSFEIILMLRLIQILGIPIGLIILYFFPFQSSFILTMCNDFSLNYFFESMIFVLPYVAIILIIVSVIFYATNIYAIIKKMGEQK